MSLTEKARKRFAESSDEKKRVTDPLKGNPAKTAKTAPPDPRELAVLAGSGPSVSETRFFHEAVTATCWRIFLPEREVDRVYARPVTLDQVQSDYPLADAIELVGEGPGSAGFYDRVLGNVAQGFVVLVDEEREEAVRIGLLPRDLAEGPMAIAAYRSRGSQCLIALPPGTDMLRVLELDLEVNS